MLVVKNRPRRPYRDVLVATDFSAGSRQRALYLVPKADLTLFHAYDVPFQGKNVPDEAVTRNFKAAEQNSKEFLAETPELAERARPKVVLECGQPETVLSEYSFNHRSDQWSPARTAAPASCAPPSAAWPNDCWSRCPAMC